MRIFENKPYVKIQQRFIIGKMYVKRYEKKIICGNYHIKYIFGSSLHNNIDGYGSGAGKFIR